MTIGIDRVRNTAGRGHGTDDRDTGTALILVLVLIVVATLIVTPMLGYAIAVTRSSRIVDTKVQRIEAVKAGLRVALADPIALYQACDPLVYGATKALELPSPPLPPPPLPALPEVKTTCNVMDTAIAEDAEKRPYGVASIQAGVPLPASFVTTPPRPDVYPGSAPLPADIAVWQTKTKLERLENTIWMPNLPGHALTPRSSDPFSMDTTAGYKPCKVFFPGTYSAPVTIAGGTEVYFTSGIYYFENTVTISDNSIVVVGGGSAEGCVTDQEAAFDALDGPQTHNITGLGATFVFGMTGRLVVKNATPASSVSVIFNQRYVRTDDKASLPSATVNIISVNGELPGNDLANVLKNMDRVGVLSVPYSLAPTSDTAFGKATLNKYRPSTLVPPDPALVPLPADQPPIIDISLATASAVNIEIPGYVAVPQGRVRIELAAGAGAETAVKFSGGMLARTIEIPVATSADFSITVADVVVQLILRLRTVTTEGTPVVVSDAIVQVNKNGAFRVNFWTVQ